MTADARWQRWIEAGWTYDRALRRRWRDGLALAGCVLVLGAAIALGLR
jgi:hypothetical protein